MASTLAALASFALYAGPPPPERLDPPELSYGYSVQENWETLWRRFQDRSGRGDDMGPYLQRRPDLDRREYPLTMGVADFPMRWERDWSLRERGARMWMHSDDEVFFLNRVQAKQSTAMGRNKRIGIRYDRWQGRLTDSSLLRLDFRFQDIGGNGTFVELRGYLRATKPDLDLQAAVGQEFEWGRVTSRFIFLDPITNAADALFRARDADLERAMRQQNPALAWTFEAQTKPIHGLRAEAYFGSILPNRLRVDYGSPAEEPDADHVRKQSAILGSGMLEYAWGKRPMRAGLSTTLVSTQHRVEYLRLPLDAYEAPEKEATAQAWWLYSPMKDFDLQLRGRFSQLGLGEVEQLPYRTVERDRQWFGEARATWVFTKPFGIETGYSVLHRDLDGPEGLAWALGGTDHRALARFVLRYRETFWVSFGAGFDLDRRDQGEVYDQGSMTMIVRW